MKLYPHKNNQKIANRYQSNLKQIAKQSNYQPIPSIPQLSDDFNFTFLVKDYDQANPYLNKNSINRGDSTKRPKHIQQMKLFQQNLLDFNSFNTSKPHIIIKKQTKQSQFKLPNIKTQIHNQINHHKERIRSKNNKKNKQKSIQLNKQKQSYKQKSIRYNKSVTLDTRLQTDDISILEEPSTSSLLKIQTKSLCKTIDAEPLNALKISKLTSPQLNPQISPQKHQYNFLQRNNLISRQLSDFSQLIQPTSPKNISRYQMIQQQQSTGQQSDQQQFIKDSVPGPGYYSISHHTSFSKPSISRNIKTGSGNFDFGSKQSRFKRQKLDQESEQMKKLKLQQFERKQKQRQQKFIRLYKRQRKTVPFNCKQQPKQQIIKNPVQQKMISPVYYNPRYGIEQQLIKKIQRNFKGGFGVGQKRFKTVYKKNYNLGPGSYSLDIKPSDQEEQKKQDYYFLSKKNRFQ